MTPEERVVITEWPYRNGDSKFPKNMVIKEGVLSEAIMEYYNRVLKPKNEKLYVHDGNIIATSNKFYGAFFEKDLKHAENHEN
jgi:hypothetical protein